MGFEEGEDDVAGAAVRAVRASAPALLAFGLGGVGCRGSCRMATKAAWPLGGTAGFWAGGGVAQDGGGGWDTPLGGFIAGAALGAMEDMFPTLPGESLVYPGVGNWTMGEERLSHKISDNLRSRRAVPGQMAGKIPNSDEDEG